MPSGHHDYHAKGAKNGRWNGGSSTHPLYEIYADMLRRCHRTTHQRYASYGGRGIVVCDSWRASFWQFVADMGPRPEGVGPTGRALYSLDRVDNDGPYSPDNCRWATYEQQGRNKRGYGPQLRDPNTGQYRSVA